MNDMGNSRLPDSRSSTPETKRHWSWSIELAWQIVDSSLAPDEKHKLGVAGVMELVRTTAQDILKSYNNTWNKPPARKKKTDWAEKKMNTQQD